MGRGKDPGNTFWQVTPKRIIKVKIRSSSVPPCLCKKMSNSAEVGCESVQQLLRKWSEAPPPDATGRAQVLQVDNRELVTVAGMWTVGWNAGAQRERHHHAIERPPCDSTPPRPYRRPANLVLAVLPQLNGAAGSARPHECCLWASAM